MIVSMRVSRCFNFHLSKIYSEELKHIPTYAHTYTCTYTPSPKFGLLNSRHIRTFCPWV